MLLALSINSLESIQAFIFYLMQYSISNLNAFILLVSIGFSLYPFVNNGPLKNQYNNLLDRNNSPIQLISQLKGYFNLNPVLALSLAITLFSFVGIPPLIGFFAKQMVLSAALDSGYVFLTLTAILTSVISAVYYLGVIKQIFFDKHEYKLNQNLQDTKFKGSVVSSLPLNYESINVNVNTFGFKINNIVLSSSLTITISILTLTLLLFIFTPQISLTSILVLIMFNP
jgi:NADH-ubiquinone oxidoreductase chain 2